MEDISKMKAPKKLKLSKPRPRIKVDVNQNDIQVKPLQPTDFLLPKSDDYALLREENYDIRGDAFESQYSSDVLNGNTNNLSNKFQEDYNRNKDKDTDVCSVGSSSTEMNGNDIALKMRAPRKVKLTKPRPLRSSKSEENDKDSTDGDIPENGNKEQDVTEKISRMINELKQGNLSVNDCLQLRDLLAVHCPHLEMINKEYIDSCFKDIEYIIRENNLDKLVLVSLRDLTALRQRAWQPYPKPSSTRRKSITWNDIYEEIPYKDCMLYSSNLPLVTTQMSMDSGIGDLEEHNVLWDTEEAFEEDLTSGIWSEYNKTQGGSKERSPSPLSVIEAVQGLKIVGEDEEFVKAAAELLQKYIRDGHVTDANNTKIDRGSKGNLKNNVIRQPIGPGTNDKIIKEVEKTLPDGMHTAKGRRTMFKTYNTAMSTERDDQEDVNGPKTYSREEILHLSLSPFSRICPLEMSYLSKVFSDVCVTKVTKYFHKDDLPVRDYSWNCPIKNQRQEDYSVENKGDFVNKSGFSHTLRRGYSCPGDSNTHSNGFNSGFGEIQKTNSGFGAPLVRRGFSCPSGDSDRVVGDDSDSGSSTGFGLTESSLKRTTSFTSQDSKFRGDVQYNNEPKSEKRGFGSPGEKQGFKSEYKGFSPVDRTQVTERKGFGSPENNSQNVRRTSLPDNTEEQWDI